jgi:hypothetical protein
MVVNLTTSETNFPTPNSCLTVFGSNDDVQSNVNHGWQLPVNCFWMHKCRFSEQLNLWWWLDIHLHIVFWYSVLPSCLIFLLETGKGYYLFFLSDSINLIASSKEFRTKSWARSFGYRKVSWFFSFSHTVTTLPCLCYFLHEDNK